MNKVWANENFGRISRQVGANGTNSMKFKVGYLTDVEDMFCLKDKSIVKNDTKVMDRWRETDGCSVYSHRLRE